jgi:hypothetical protein
MDLPLGKTRCLANGSQNRRMTLGDGANCFIAADNFTSFNWTFRWIVADNMFCLPTLDQIGPARYADEAILTLVNQRHQGISEVPTTIVGGP